MSENFSGAIRCRDAFDMLSTATVDWLVTNGTEEISRSKAIFDKQVGNILENMQPSRGPNGPANEHGADDSGLNDISMILSNENFAFGEMLSSAAQWPDIENVEFIYMGFDDMGGTGVNLSAYTFL